MPVLLSLWLVTVARPRAERRAPWPDPERRATIPALKKTVPLTPGTCWSEADLSAYAVWLRSRYWGPGCLRQKFLDRSGGIVYA